MKRIHAALRAGMLAAMLGFAGTLAVAPANAQLAVFDTSNYAQNLLQAARALQQINNQVKSLQNEATMLQNMAKNLQKVSFPQLQQITSSMQRIDQLMAEANGIDFKVEGLEQRVEQLFPGALRRALTANEEVTNARARLDAAQAAYRRSIEQQAQVAQNVQQDAAVLAQLASTSQGAVGALQVGQAANQLLALSVKQQLQLQDLMASEFRENAIERARRAQSEEDGRAMTRRFLEGPASN